MYKGVTPVVATVLLMTISVGAAGTLYTTIQANQDNAREQLNTDLSLNTDQLKIEQCYNQSTNTYLAIRNTNLENAVNTSKISPLLNGTPTENYNTNPEIANPQQTFTVEFTDQFGSETQIILTDGDQQIEHSCYGL